MTTLLPIDTLGSAGLRRVMVTGANGFVGRVLCRHLGTHGVDVLAVTRENVHTERTEMATQHAPDEAVHTSHHDPPQEIGRAQV